MSAVSSTLSHTVQWRGLVRREPDHSPAVRDIPETADREASAASQMRLVSQRRSDHDVRALQGGAVQVVSHVTFQRGQGRDKQTPTQDRGRLGQIHGERGRVDQQARDEFGQVQRDQADDSEARVRHHTAHQGRGDQAHRRC